MARARRNAIRLRSMVISFAAFYAYLAKRLARPLPAARRAGGGWYTPAAMPIDEAAFKLAMSHFASGVTVVTTEHGGKPFGMTVASFASLSLHPPLVLICIEKGVKTHDAIAAAGKFGVSILTEAQGHISSRFASRVDDKFSGIEVRRGSLR